MRRGEPALARECIALYKQIRPIIRNADVYHLTDQVNHESPATVQSVQYVDSQTGRSVVFVFQGGDRSLRATIELRGLRREVSYRVSMPPAFGPDRFGMGTELMQGLRIYFPHRGSSAVLQISPETAR
jgi:alpha-galactosidase